MWRICSGIPWRWIADDDLEIEELVYVDDNLYDRVGDMIALFYKAHPESIPFLEDNRQ